MMTAYLVIIIRVFIVVALVFFNSIFQPGNGEGGDKGSERGLFFLTRRCTAAVFQCMIVQH